MEKSLQSPSFFDTLPSELLDEISKCITSSTNAQNMGKTCLACFKSYYRQGVERIVKIREAIAALAQKLNLKGLELKIAEMPDADDIKRYWHDDDLSRGVQLITFIISSTNNVSSRWWDSVTWEYITSSSNSDEMFELLKKEIPDKQLIYDFKLLENDIISDKDKEIFKQETNAIRYDIQYVTDLVKLINRNKSLIRYCVVGGAHVDKTYVTISGHKRHLLVRKTKDGLKYVISEKKKVFLRNIRGKYKYVK